MEVGAARPRVRLYERGTPAAGLAVTDRDVSMLRDLADNRFMTTQQFQAVHGPRITARLKLLFRHGLIERPKAGRFWRFREGGGSNALLLALAHRGAQVLAARGYPEALKRDWTELNRELSQFSPAIPHILDLASVKVAFRKAVNDVPGLELRQGFELSPERSLLVPGRDRRLVPDWTITLGMASAATDPSLFFIEKDKSTEPNRRYRSPGLQSLAFKFSGYLAFARARQHHRQFGLKNFRVLTITDGGETKMANVARTAFEVTGGVGVERFLVTSSAELARVGPLRCAWLNAAGQATILAP